MTKTVILIEGTRTDIAKIEVRDTGVNCDINADEKEVRAEIRDTIGNNLVTLHRIECAPIWFLKKYLKTSITGIGQMTTKSHQKYHWKDRRTLSQPTLFKN